MNRYSSKDFPPYLFIPGKSPHPEKKGGYLHGKEITGIPLEQKNYHENSLYLYAIDLFNFQYYWDAHVYWEVLWNHAGRTGQVADFLKGLIKLAAAGVKFQLDQADLAQKHLERAVELLSKIETPFYGINTKDLVNSIENNPNQELLLKLTLES